MKAAHLNDTALLHMKSWTLLQQQQAGTLQNGGLIQADSEMQVSNMTIPQIQRTKSEQV